MTQKWSWNFVFVKSYKLKLIWLPEEEKENARHGLFTEKWTLCFSAVATVYTYTTYGWHVQTLAPMCRGTSPTIVLCIVNTVKRSLMTYCDVNISCKCTNKFDCLEHNAVHKTIKTLSQPTVRLNTRKCTLVVILSLVLL